MTDSDNGIHPWEGVYSLPNALIPRCSWCRKPSEVFSVVVFEVNLPDVTRDVQSAVVCASCADLVRDYIALRKAGLSHRVALRDLCIRN